MSAIRRLEENVMFWLEGRFLIIFLASLNLIKFV